mgnify:CR=1 FL=1|tara:strand:+ start:1602 stop:2117 length:516 start_codon:yes stop_codon:yes gene_type:complete
MANGNLPPQAFSSQEVNKAMRWLDQQPKHIKTMVDSTAALMALYRQASLYGDKFYEKYPSVNEERFRQDLHNIANQLSGFSGKQKPQVKSHDIILEEEETAKESSTVEKERLNFSVEREKSSTTRSQNLSEALDSLSKQRIADVKRRLNLSSDTEVIRMLITLGAERLKDL